MLTLSHALPRKIIHLCVVASCGLCMPMTSLAQLVAPASGASAPVSSDMERAQRQANNVLRWIKVHSDNPKANPAKPAAAPAPVSNPVASKPPARNTNTVNAISAVNNTAATNAPPPTASVPQAEISPQVTSTAPALNATVPATVPEPSPPPTPAVQAPPAAAAVPEVVLVAVSQTPPELSQKITESLNNDRVNVRFTVLPNGTVTGADIINSTNRRLNRPTLDAVATWRFQPIPANHTVTVELAFKD